MPSPFPARFRAALTHPVDPVLWAFDWRAWVVVVAVVAIVDACHYVA